MHRDPYRTCHGIWFSASFGKAGTRGNEAAGVFCAKIARKCPFGDRRKSFVRSLRKESYGDFGKFKKFFKKGLDNFFADINDLAVFGIG